MSNSLQTETETRRKKTIPEAVPCKRVILNPGKGGAGKTTVMGAIAEYLDKKSLKAQKLDFDVENRVACSFQHFFPDASKHDFRKRGEIDHLVLSIENSAASIVLADFGAGARSDTIAWFDEMYLALRKRNVQCTFVGVIDGDIGSLKVILDWASSAAHLENIQWVIVLNEVNNPGEKFAFWEMSDDAIAFRERFQPPILKLRSRTQEFQNLLRNYGAKLSDVVDEKFPKGQVETDMT